MRKFILGTAWMLAIALTGCGGGGGDGGASTTPPAQAPTSGNSQPPTPAVNQVAVAVARSTDGYQNELTTTVTICVPGTSNCVTIADVLVDTGSYGLRIQAAAFGSSLTLPSVHAKSGGQLLECASFGSGITWGSVATADVMLGGEVASKVPVQIIGDPAYASIPGDCSALSTRTMNTIKDMGATGILGVGLQTADCGSACVTQPQSGTYYNCPTATTCAPTSVAIADQVTNPVSMFASDNNGVVIQLPTVPDTGYANVSGTMTFGIGTQADNALGSAQVFTTDPEGYISTQYGGATDSISFLDSGSNSNFFTDPSIAQCSGNSFYCPTSTLSLSAVMQGHNGINATVQFPVANATAMTMASDYAMDSLAADWQPGIFDWGLPFFYGRTIYTAIAGSATPAGKGPFFAF